MRSTSVAAANVAQNAAGNSRLWEDKSAEEIRRDINAALRLVYVESMTIEYANTILLPPDALAILAETITANDRTLLEVIQRSNITTLITGQPLTFAALLGLEDAGDSGTGRMVAYRRDPDVCTYIQPRISPRARYGRSTLGHSSCRPKASRPGSTGCGPAAQSTGTVSPPSPRQSSSNRHKGAEMLIENVCQSQRYTWWLALP